MATDHDLATFHHCWILVNYSHTRVYGLSIPGIDFERPVPRNMEIVQTKYGDTWHWPCKSIAYQSLAD